MGIFDYSDPIIIQRRTEYVLTSEDLVVENSKVVLREIPDRVAKVQVTGGNVSIWLEKATGSLDTNNYKVDYNGNVISFHSSANGKSLHLEYMATGLNLIPTSIIYNEVNSQGNVVSTLKDIITEGNSAITALSQVNTAVQNATNATNAALTQTTYAQQQGDYAKEQGDLATIATSAANSAASAASAASTSATSAASAASSAKDDADVATANANAAVIAASNATDLASSAATAANQSKTNADSSATLANDAAASASVASTSATGAADLANSAADAANVAKTNADTATANTVTSTANANDAAALASSAASDATNSATNANTINTNVQNAELIRVSQESARETSTTDAINNLNNKVASFSYFLDYDNTVAYKVNNQFTYNKNAYITIVDAPIGTPPTDTTYFRIFAHGGADGAGTVASISPTNGDVIVGGSPQEVTLTINTGTGANQILKLDATAEITADILKDGTTIKTVTQSEKDTWNAKQDALASTVTQVDTSVTEVMNAHTDANGVVHNSLKERLDLEYDNQQTSLNNHTGATANAHPAEAISYSNPTYTTLTDLKAVIDELYAKIADAKATALDASKYQ